MNIDLYKKRALTVERFAWVMLRDFDVKSRVEDDGYAYVTFTAGATAHTEVIAPYCDKCAPKADPCECEVDEVALATEVVRQMKQKTA